MSANEWAATTKRIDDAVEALATGHPMTIRQLFYRLVSTEAIVNCQAHYQRLCRDMTKARKDERVTWDWIVDRSRPAYAVNAFSNLPEYGRAIRHSYRRDNWQDQPAYPESRHRDPGRTTVL